MKVFVCVGGSIILTFLLMAIGLEMGVLDCNGQPCSVRSEHGEGQ